MVIRLRQFLPVGRGNTSEAAASGWHRGNTSEATLSGWHRGNTSEATPSGWHSGNAVNSNLPPLNLYQYSYILHHTWNITDDSLNRLRGREHSSWCWIVSKQASKIAERKRGDVGWGGCRSLSSTSSVLPIFVPYLNSVLMAFRCFAYFWARLMIVAPSVSDFLYRHNVTFDNVTTEVEILDTSKCAVSSSCT